MDKEQIVKLSEDDWAMVLGLLESVAENTEDREDALTYKEIEDTIKQQIKEQIENGN